MSQVFINELMDKLIPAFGWMLIHSLWQGLLFAIITGIVLMLTKKSNATYRYNLALVLFIAFIGMCAATFIFEWNNNAAPGALRRLLPGADGTAAPVLLFGNAHTFKHFVDTLTAYFSANEPLLVLIWFIIFLFKSVKMLGCLVYNQQVRTRQVTVAPEFWVSTVQAFAEKLQIKKAVKLLQSGYIKMPVVIGHLKPVILIPVGLLAGLPTEQVEAILLHELAHIRRNDYFVNFLQNIAEAIFFFNPGLLWISSLLREERENCCDDIAVAQTQNKVGFVQALISFKEHELSGSRYAVAFAGKKNYLLRRVSRILSDKNKTFGRGEKVFFIGSILILSVLMTAASVARIKENVKPGFGHMVSAVSPVKSPRAHREIAVINIVKTSGPVSAGIKRAKEKAATEMRNGIPDITPETEAVSIAINKQEFVERQEAASDEQRAGSLSEREQARKDQEQARIDQIQALKDEAVAVKDQEQARLDQVQALKDQAQALKDRAPVQMTREQSGKARLQVDKTQAAVNRDEEQARLNQAQEKKNEEQAKRNEEQARLNRIQEKKNEEQAVRNEEQARLNKIQEQKNEEQARKNSASVQK